MDAGGLYRIIIRRGMALTVPTVLDDVIMPLLVGIGADWEMGRMRPAQEDLATVVIRRSPEWALGMDEVGTGAPVLVAANAGRGEARARCSAMSGLGGGGGLREHLSGADLPAEQTVSAARRLGAQVIALSGGGPWTTGSLGGEIRTIREGLPAEGHLVLGGPAPCAHFRAGGWTELRY